MANILLIYLCEFSYIEQCFRILWNSQTAAVIMAYMYSVQITPAKWLKSVAHITGEVPIGWTQG